MYFLFAVPTLIEAIATGLYQEKLLNELEENIFVA